MTNEPVLRNPDATDDSAPLEELFFRYARQGARYAFSILRHATDAEEITQEAFCRLAAKSAEWDGKNNANFEHFPALFFTTIRNLSIDLIRKNKRQPCIALDASMEPAARPETDDAQRMEMKVVLLIQQLPDRWADALNLKVNGQLSYAEIAEVLDVTHAQVRTWIYRARRRLESELTKAGLSTVGS